MHARVARYKEYVLAPPPNQKNNRLCILGVFSIRTIWRHIFCKATYGFLLVERLVKYRLRDLVAGEYKQSKNGVNMFSDRRYPHRCKFNHDREILMSFGLILNFLSILYERFCRFIVSLFSLNTSIVPLFVFTLISLFLLPVQSHAAGYINLPRDGEGWTVFTPSSDSRIIYVAADGDNTTGKVYSKESPEIGNDPFNPVGPIKPFKGTWHAYQQTRDNMPDWVLYKRGDSFTEAIQYFHRSGRSAKEPYLIGAYGSSGPPPIMKIGDGAFGMKTGPTRSWLAISGIDFYAYTRDPASPDYVPGHSNTGVSLYADGNNPQEGFLFEGCKFRMTAMGMEATILNGGGITVRRCSFIDNYPKEAHAMGFIADNVDGLILEENIFDKGGWYSQAGSGGIGQATMYNHNTYVGRVKNTAFRNNIFMRPASMNNKFTSDYGAASTVNVTVSNNLYVDGEIGIDMGGNDFAPYRFKGILIEGNVITNMNMSRPTNRDIAYGIQVSDWDGGIVKNNLILHSNAAGTYAFLPGYTSRNVTITDNIVYDLKQVNAIFQTGSTTSTGMVFSENKIQQIELIGPIMNLKSAVVGNWTYSGNKYNANLNDSQRYSIDGVPKTLVQWQAATGDNSTFEQVSFPDPTRSIETYMDAIGETPTLDAFYVKCRAQNRYNWDSRFTADSVNTWIKVQIPDDPGHGFHMIPAGDSI